jgi:hypothetical protein
VSSDDFGLVIRRAPERRKASTRTASACASWFRKETETVPECESVIATRRFSIGRATITREDRCLNPLQRSWETNLG